MLWMVSSMLSVICRRWAPAAKMSLWRGLARFAEAGSGAVFVRAGKLTASVLPSAYPLVHLRIT